MRQEMGEEELRDLLLSSMDDPAVQLRPNGRRDNGGLPPERGTATHGPPPGRGASPPEPMPMGRQPHAPARGGLLNFQRKRQNAPAIGAVLIIVGLLLWTINAEYTAQGLVSLLNTVFTWFRVPLEVGRLDWYFSLPLGVVLGWFITQAQVREFPIQYKNKVVMWGGLGMIAGWVLVSGFDVITTAQGFTILAEDAWDIHRQASQSLFATGVYAVVLAFMPEAIIVAGWSLLGWPVPAMFKRG